jgi:hypothetical protein
MAAEEGPCQLQVGPEKIQEPFRYLPQRDERFPL